MNIVVVDDLPKKTTQKHRTNNISGYLEEFVNMNVKFAKLEFHAGEYSRIESARQSIHQSVRTHGFPIKVCVRNRELYLVRKDI